MSRVSDLVDAYETELHLPWRPGVSGAERVWMLVYPPDLERQVRAQLPELGVRTTNAQRGWEVIDLSDELGRWVARHEYAAAFYEDPGDFTSSIVDMFSEDLVLRLRERLSVAGDDAVVALVGAASLFPFVRASALIQAVDDAVRGRLLVLFPGRHDPDSHSFRLLDARDGFNYRARVITSEKNAR
ncbi:BREX protein BrxB domain-containing protein [Cellulosimicrobium funkei]|uniref:BREX protein BrxB domain-containing protein n=1 Tax=Cellulosimicrobium funkei TaxID=264251 RepID=UPI0037035D20